MARIHKTTMVQRLALRNTLPLDIMLEVMDALRDRGVEELRLAEASGDTYAITGAFERLKDAAHVASNAAPYVHSKLASVTLSGDPDKPLHIELSSAEELRKMIRGGS